MLESGPRSPQVFPRKCRPANAAESDRLISITEKKSASEACVMPAGAIDTVLRGYRRILAAQTACVPVERPGFSGALVGRIETPAGPFCLRGWPLGTESSEKILALHEFLAYVRAREINYVPVPVACDEGITLVWVAGRFWQLEPWLPGHADFWSRPSDVRLAAAFVALARFHQAARGFRPAGGRPSHLGPAEPAVAPTVLDRIERLEGWGPLRLTELRERICQWSGDGPAVALAAGRVLSAFERCAPRIERNLRSASQMPVPLQPCLRDVWHDHVLFQGDEVTGLIDPSAARTDTVAADISRLAGSLIADDRLAWGRAIDAYESVRPLSEEEAALVGILDRSGVLLSGMAWLERRYFEGVFFTERALERLQRIAARLSLDS
jgi:Ser/Thr protein kinase RdoA (MazF antagonist)